MSRTRIALFFGGQSAEHNVSLESAKNVADALDPKSYEISLVAIDRQGVWRYMPDLAELRKTDVSRPIDVSQAGEPIALIPITQQSKSSSTAGGRPARAALMSLGSGKVLSEIDVVFPILHGPYGEDGTIQGFFRTIGVPFAGCGILGSSVGMDKDFTKRLLHEAGLPIGKYECLWKHEAETPGRHDFHRVAKAVGLPFFLKPANMGSSVGVYKVSEAAQFKTALNDAFRYDTKVLLEEFTPGREIECAVLGNENPKPSIAGEIIPQHEFYSYEAKYLDENGAALKIPANLNDQQMQEVRELAVKVYRLLGCEGMTRVDFFLQENGRLLVNEINTIPGFTKISMYPKMWNATGLGYAELIDQLVQLAFSRFDREQSLQR